MRIYLERNGLYWTGRVGSTKDGKELRFILTEKRREARAFDCIGSALEYLHMWGTYSLPWNIECDSQVPERKFCEKTKRDQEYKPIRKSDFLEYNSGFYAPDHIDGVFSYQPDKTTNTNPMQRTLSEICKDADNNCEDSVKLFNLMEEVKTGDLSQSHYDYAVEYINEKIEALKDNLRKQRTRSKFEED